MTGISGLVRKEESLRYSIEAGWVSQDRYPLQMGDVNGDGLADIVAFGGGGTYVSLAQANGGFTTQLVSNEFGYGADAGSWLSQDRNPRFVADVNGDGYDDIVGFHNDGVYVALA